MALESTAVGCVVDGEAVVSEDGGVHINLLFMRSSAGLNFVLCLAALCMYKYESVCPGKY